MSDNACADHNVASRRRGQRYKIIEFEYISVTLKRTYIPKGAWVMVIGGRDPYGRQDLSTAVEVVSPDPSRNPIPECLKNVGRLPYRLIGGSAANLGRGKLPEINECRLHSREGVVE